MNFNMMEYDKIIDMVLDPILQLTFKKLWPAKDWYGITEEIPSILWKGY